MSSHFAPLLAAATIVKQPQADDVIADLANKVVLALR